MINAHSSATIYLAPLVHSLKLLKSTWYRATSVPSLVPPNLCHLSIQSLWWWCYLLPKIVSKPPIQLRSHGCLHRPHKKVEVQYLISALQHNAIEKRPPSPLAQSDLWVPRHWPDYGRRPHLRKPVQKQKQKFVIFGFSFGRRVVEHPLTLTYLTQKLEHDKCQHTTKHYIVDIIQLLV